MSKPPRPSDLGKSAMNFPKEQGSFLQTLLTGKISGQMKTIIQECRGSEMKPFTQGLMFEVRRGKIKPPKQIRLPYAVKTVTDIVELIQMLSRYGHRIACSQPEEINNALCLQKMTLSHIPLLSRIQRHVGITLAWDNIDHLEEKLSGEGTSHRVN